jgi:LEA14-like dessication related protein
MVKEPNSGPIMIHALEGDMLLNEVKIRKGEHALCSFSTGCLISPSEDSSVLITDRFC